jgi:glycosyltransferase involved in cell wall biosynthesis
MKVAFISTLYAPNESGGAERTVRTLAEALVARGQQAVVITLAPDGRARDSVLNGVQVYYVPLANLYWLLQAGNTRGVLSRLVWHGIDAFNPVMAWRVRKILRRERPDVLQTGNLQGFSVAVWRTAKRLKIPVVQMLHDYYLGCPKSTMFSGGHNCVRQCAACRLFRTPARASSAVPTAVISLSRRLLQRLEETGLFTRVRNKHIINGINNAVVQPAPRADKSPGSPLIAGYLGRMESTKGIETLLEAATRLPDQLTLLLGGQGDANYLQQLQRRYASPNIRFLGFVKPADFFSRIDVLVVPSVWEEPLGRVIYEGFAHGIPSVVANVGGMPEIVTPGHTGHVVEPGDANAIVNYLQEQIECGWPGARFFAACTRRSQDFSVEHVFDEYLRVWNSAAQPSSPAWLSTAHAEGQ